jgi:hypothetical protein
MSMANFFNTRSYLAAKQNLEQCKAKLEEHLKTDYQKLENDMREAVTHWEGVVVEAAAKVNPRTLLHLNEGAHPDHAIEMTESGAPTRAEAVAAQNAAAEKTKSAIVQ